MRASLRRVKNELTPIHSNGYGKFRLDVEGDRLSYTLKFHCAREIRSPSPEDYYYSGHTERLFATRLEPTTACDEAAPDAEIHLRRIDERRKPWPSAQLSGTYLQAARYRL